MTKLKKLHLKDKINKIIILIKKNYSTDKIEKKIWT